MNLIRCFVVVCVFLVFSGLYGQSVRFDHFDISGGLSQNNINGLVIDDKGNIWVGTLDGLNKYNGYAFEIFKPISGESEGISGNHIISMGSGLNGDIWITTREGVLNRYQADVKSFRQYPDTLFIAAGVFPFQNLIQQNDSLLWFSDGANAGLLHLERNECLKYGAGGLIRGMITKGDSAFLYGRFGIEYLKPIMTGGTIDLESSRISNFPCYHLARDGSSWYVVSDRGIELLLSDFTSRTPVVAFEALGLSGLSASMLNSFAVHKGTFWLGDDNLLVRIRKEGKRYNADRFRYDPENDFSFKGYHVTHLQFDKLGNLWIGTQKNGLNHFNYRKNQFLHYNWNRPLLTSPDTDPVRAICKRKNGEIWLGFDRNGIGIIGPGGEQTYIDHYYTSNGEKKAITNVRSIYEDSSGNIWIGESKGLFIYNESRRRIETAGCQYAWDWPYYCYSVKELEPGTLTLTSTQKIGLVSLETGELSVIELNVDDGNHWGNVRDIVKDNNGHLWIAKNENGLIKYEGRDTPVKAIRTSTHGLSDNKVYCLLARGDSLWIGTNAGLNLFSISGDTILRKYFEKDGLSNNIVYSLMSDSKDHLWMSTNRGITRFDPETGQFTVYLGNDFFMDDAYCADEAGFIFYGGYTGVVSFHPDSIVAPHSRIKACFEGFHLFNREVFPGDTVGKRVLIKQPLESGDEIRLKHDENSFSILVGAYPFDYPNHNICRYRLSGLQEEWVYLSPGNRQASYTVVPPGEYHFELQAGATPHSFGATAQLKIVIVPPFWRTSWFKGGLMLLLLGLILGGYQIRLRQVRKRNLLLKTRVEEQTKELRERNQQILEMSQKLHEADQSKLRFFTNISHDFRTPLTLILAHLDHLDRNKARAVRIIRNNARRLLNMINQLIDLRKLDQGKLKLSVSKFDVISFIQEVIQNFQPLANQKNIEIRFFSSREKLEVWLDVDKMENIVGNLLSNAIKYSSEGSPVLVSVGEKENWFYIEVEDQGPGMSEEEVKNIFDRFYRSENVEKHTSGHGIGLTIVKGLTELQKGKVAIKSSKGSGTRFRLYFLSGRDHYAAGDFGNSNLADALWKENLILEDITDDFSRFSGQKILVAEDNPELSGLLKELLEKWFEVRIAGNGKQALKMVSDFPPDLIISDIMMPVMDGIEFCKIVKSDARTSHIPIVLLTARIDEEVQIEGFQLGVDDYIEKPFNTRIFLARVKSLLENRQKIRRHLETDDNLLTVDPALSDQDKDFLNSVNVMIEEKYSDSAFNVEVLSKELFMSRSSFYRKFKNLTGMTAADYLRKIRLHKAARLIKYEEVPVSEVAEYVGFQSVAHFRKSFKNEFGSTPGSWSKKYRSKDVRP
ncbi:ATP-binding protein [Thermophagus sp. OGC60D27]|uniref:ATP-binding protein n=1 Tax=Thermophagus sp. OGC60D27 TaxID=3458415 RepID=UPI004037FC10